jgi:hypothetical protein
MNAFAETASYAAQTKVNAVYRQPMDVNLECLKVASRMFRSSISEFAAGRLLLLAILEVAVIVHENYLLEQDIKKAKDGITILNDEIINNLEIRNDLRARIDTLNEKIRLANDAEYYAIHKNGEYMKVAKTEAVAEMWEIAHGSDFVAKAEVADSDIVSEDILDYLASDESAVVREAVAGNELTLPETLESKLVNDKVKSIRDIAEKNLETKKGDTENTINEEKPEDLNLSDESTVMMPPIEEGESAAGAVSEELSIH